MNVLLKYNFDIMADNFDIWQKKYIKYVIISPMN